jgi:hypothetical protein
MSRDESSASIFAAFYEFERKYGSGGGGGGKPKIEVAGKGGGKLRLGGGNRGQRVFHPGHRLAGTRINNVVKVKYVRNNNDATRHIIQHIDYIEKRERGREEKERTFYDRNGEKTRDQTIDTIMKNRGEHAAMFKIMLSPKQNELDHVKYTREIMARFEEKTGIVTDWILVKHENTQYHHVHIVMPGKDVDGNSFRLEKEHLDLLREIANEYQYELQDRDYKYERQIEHEFDLIRDQFNRMIEMQRDRRDQKSLGIYRPDIDKQVEEDLLHPTNFDDLKFIKQLENEVMNNVADDFKQLQAELEKNMQEKHPELYPGLLRELQNKDINDAYFQKLKEFHPDEYYKYMHDPSLDRSEVIGRLKQAFPEWFDGIIAQLKQDKPELFGKYEKPAPSDREVMDNLRNTNPELFPELSKQIQENQLNMVTLAYLSQEKPELFKQILEQPSAEKQKEMLADARKQYPEQMQQAQEKLAQKYPEIYKWSETKETNTKIMAELAKSNPTLFPQALEELKRHEVDNKLFELYRQQEPEKANVYELDPHARGLIVTLMRCDKEKLEQVTKELKEQQPELFTYAPEGKSQTEILAALLKEHKELFPEAMQNLKNQEINKQYFERAREAVPDKLQHYVDNPDLDRTDLHAVLRNAFPEWRPEIESQLKESMPHLFKYDPPRSHTEILNEQREKNPELFPGMERQKEPHEPPHADRPDQIEKEKLIDEAYFERGQHKLSDGLRAYLDNNEFDRSAVIKGLRGTFPEWQKEIEQALKQIHPHLFKEQDRQKPQQNRVDERKEAADKLKEIEKEAADSPNFFREQAALMLTLAGVVHEIQKADEHDQPEVGAGDQDKIKSDKEHEKELGVEQDTKDIAADAEKLHTGMQWGGLTGFKDTSFIGEHIDLEAEARLLYGDQQKLSEIQQEVDDHAVQIDPEIFKIGEITQEVEHELKDHEKEKEQDERSGE